jgi:uncharacterized protein
MAEPGRRRAVEYAHRYNAFFACTPVYDGELQSVDLLGRAIGLSTCVGTAPPPVRQVCGGGLYAHRYEPNIGFDNPSVYCADLAPVDQPVRTVLN